MVTKPVHMDTTDRIPNFSTSLRLHLMWFDGLLITLNDSVSSKFWSNWYHACKAINAKEESSKWQRRVLRERVLHAFIEPREELAILELLYPPKIVPTRIHDTGKDEGIGWQHNVSVTGHGETPYLPSPSSMRPCPWFRIIQNSNVK